MVFCRLRKQFRPESRLGRILSDRRHIDRPEAIRYLQISFKWRSAGRHGSRKLTCAWIKSRSLPMILRHQLHSTKALGLELIVIEASRYARFAVDDTSTISVEVTGTGRAGSVEIFLCRSDVDRDHAAAVACSLVFDWPPTDQSYKWRTAGLCDPAGNRIVRFSAGTNQHLPPWRLDGREAS